MRRHCQALVGMDMAPWLRDFVQRWARSDATEHERMIRESPSLRWLARDVEVHIHGGPSPGRRRGWDAVVQFFAEWYTLWEDYSVEVEDYRDLGAGATLTRTHVRGHGRGGIPVELTSFELRRVSDDLIVSWEMFDNENDALAAAAPK